MEEETVIDLDEPEKADPKKAPLEYEDEDPNLVRAFRANEDGLAWLKKFSLRVKRRFDSEWDASEEMRQRKADNMLIFAGKLPKKQFPFEDCANVNIPIALETITRLHFRAIGELYGDWSRIFDVLPTGPDDEAVASLLTRHGNWQLREECLDFRRQQYRALLLYYMQGDVAVESYRDTFRDINRHDTLTCDDLVIPYAYTSTMPDLSDCPYYFVIKRYKEHELEDQAEIWEGVDEVLERKNPPWDSEPDSRMKEAADEAAGISISSDTDSGAPYKILQYEGWEKLPGQKRQRWVKAYVDYATGNVLHLALHEEADWQEQALYEAQLEERQAYLNGIDDHAAMLRSYDDALAMQADAPPQIDPLSGMPLQAPPLPEPPPPPPMPLWMSEKASRMAEDDEADVEVDDLGILPDRPKMRPIHMIARAVCIEPLAGSIGIGFGDIEADFNRAANTLINQAIDAATLSNAGGFIISSLVQFEEKFSYRPGKMNRLKAGISGEELSKNIFPLRPPPANPQMVELAQKVYEWGQSAIQAPDVLSGESGKSGETFRGIATRVEQATKQLSVSTRNYATSCLTPTLRNNARLNAIFMPESQFVSVNDHVLGKASRFEVGRAMYRRNYRVSIAADLKFSSEAQRISEADQLIELGLKYPPLGQDLAYMHGAYKRALEARGKHDMVPTLGEAPPLPKTPFAIMPAVPQQPGGPLPTGQPTQPNGPSGPAPEGPPQQ